MRKLMFLPVICLIILTGCADSRVASYDGYRTKTYKTESNNDEQNSVERLIIYNGYLDMTVKDMDTVTTAITSIAKKYGGYVVEAGTYQNVIRVKSEKLNLAIAEIELLGEIENKSVTGTDVTEEYTDYQIRIDNAKKARERYLELLAKAENVEAALLVEKELERLNNEIELIEGKMNKIGHLAEFSTITIDLREKVKLGPLGYVTVGLYEGVKWLFVRN